MKFRKLTIENYKSFQFATEIRFPVGDDGRSIFLIGGMNGAGKTSIMEAINYCLYGAKPDEIFRNINRREKARGNARVSFELVMEMDDHSELVVKRSWSAFNAKSIILLLRGWLVSLAFVIPPWLTFSVSFWRGSYILTRR